MTGHLHVERDRVAFDLPRVVPHPEIPKGEVWIVVSLPNYPFFRIDKVVDVKIEGKS